MCAIVDANVVGEVFGNDRPPAGDAFFNWINSGRSTVVIGGKLRKELYASSTKFGGWAAEAYRANVLTFIDDDKVDQKTKQLANDDSCKSNDEHIIALAQLSGARLLYSNDGDLHEDFGDKSLINDPRGKVYSTLRNKNFTRGKRDLLQRKDLCGAPQ